MRSSALMAAPVGSVRRSTFAGRLAASLALAAAIGLGAAGGASASTTYYVDDQTDAPLAEPSGTTCVSTHEGSCTLRAAVQAADNLDASSTIVLPEVEFALEIPSTSADNPANGDLDIKGSETSITIEGSGGGRSAINANHIDRAFTVQNGASLTLQNVLIKNGSQLNEGSSASSTDPGAGGAVLNLGVLTVLNSALDANSALKGAAIAAGNSATITSIEGSTVEHNAADEKGGAAFASAGLLYVYGDRINDNDAHGAGGALAYDRGGSSEALEVYESDINHNISGGEGGAIFTDEARDLRIGDDEIAGNSTADDDGGAIYAADSGEVSIYDADIAYDTSGDSEGGGIYADEDAGGLVVDDSGLYNDTAGGGNGGAIATSDTDLFAGGVYFGGDQGDQGGAVYVSGRTSEDVQEIVTSEFSDNQSTYGGGGAVYDERGELVMGADTFAFNSASSDGGALYYGSSDGLNLTNDTFEGNQAADAGGAIDLHGDVTEGIIVLLNDTIVRNLSFQGGGIYEPERATGIENTIVADNDGESSSHGGGDCYGPYPTENAGGADLGGNIDSDHTCFSEEVEHDHPGVALVGVRELRFNTGPTWTDSLESDSPAIGAGVSEPIPCPETDQREVHRVGACDAGAFQRDPADVGITVSASPNGAVGQANTYTLTVKNHGPGPATGVEVTDTLPGGAAFAGYTASDGSCDGGSTVTCGLGALEERGEVTITITVTPEEAGSQTDHATVAGEEEDPEEANNEGLATTDVSPATTTITTTNTEATQTLEVVKTVSAVETVSTVQTVHVPTGVSGSVNAPAAQCKSKRSETISWKVASGVRLARIVIAVNGKVDQTLAGTSRTATVSMAGLPKGKAVVNIVGITRSGAKYSLTRVYHLCVTRRPGPRDPGDYLTLSR